jgi:5-methylcytosine-specific restriction endonuclease McrA
MSRYISEELRQLVIARAGNLCEYCLANIDWTFYGGAIDHIIAIQHDGPTEANNLAYTCQLCNRNKGSNIASLNWRTKQLVRLFNPRTDRWSEHFVLDGA